MALIVDNKLFSDTMVLAQLLGGDGVVSTIITLFMLFFFIVLYPRIMLSQIMWKLERTAQDLERMSKNSKEFLAKEISSNPTKELKDSVSRFFEFFVITPVTLDPFGSIPKFDHILRNQKDRFDYFVKQIAPKADAEKRANIAMGFAGGITVHEIFKIVRHYVEFVRKTKSIQIAIVLQMQLPLIERIAKSMYRGTKALAKGQVIGDGIGPMYAASLIGERKIREIEEDTIFAEVPIDGRTAFVVKAVGPGGRLGRPGRAVEKLAAQHKIERVITIDAAAKLEGEKTGSIAEGVGAAMGGPGVEKSYIEGVVVKKKIPLDSIIVKMSSEEAIQPMRKSVKDALVEVDKSLKRSLERTKKGDKIVVVGVGNTSGVGNDKKSVEKTKDWVDKNEKKIQARKKQKKKRGRKKKDIDEFEYE